MVKTAPAAEAGKKTRRGRSKKACLSQRLQKQKLKS
jgi:hypothetical protein